MHWQVRGLRACHDGVDGNLLDGELPELAVPGGPELADDLVRPMARSGQHALDTLLGRQDDREVVGPALLTEEDLQAVLGVRLEDAWCRPVGGQPAQVLVRERSGQLLEDLLDEGTRVNGILALDVSAQLARGLRRDGRRDERAAGARLPVRARDRLHEASEGVGMHATAGTPYSDSSVFTWPETSGEHMLQRPTPRMAASPWERMRSESTGSGRC